MNDVHLLRFMCDDDEGVVVTQLYGARHPQPMCTTGIQRISPPERGMLYQIHFSSRKVASFGTIIPENFGINYPEVYQVPENIGQ